MSRAATAAIAITVTLLLLAALLFGLRQGLRTFLHDDTCERVHALGQDRKLVAALEAWVTRNHALGRLEKRHSIRGWVFYPGEYKIAIDDPNLKRRLGPDAEAVVLTNADGRIIGVFFGYGNYRGLTVKIRRGEQGIDVVDQYLTWRTSRVCIVRD